MSFVCPCGCDLRLSPRDAGAERWLEELAGSRPESSAPISLAVQQGVSRYAANHEPMSRLECGKCGDDVEAATYIAEFLDRWGMGSPDCATCHAKQKRGAA